MHGNSNIILKWIFKKQGSSKWRAVVSTAINCRVPQNAAHFLTSRGTISFSGRTLLYVVKVTQPARLLVTSFYSKTLPTAQPNAAWSWRTILNNILRRLRKGSMRKCTKTGRQSTQQPGISECNTSPLRALDLQLACCRDRRLPSVKIWQPWREGDARPGCFPEWTLSSSCPSSPSLSHMLHSPLCTLF